MVGWHLRISSTHFHLSIITRRNILDVASFYIAMLRIREHNSFVPESKRYAWLRGWLTHSGSPGVRAKERGRRMRWSKRRVMASTSVTRYL